MSGSLTLVWIVCVAVEVYIVALALRRRTFFRYFPLNFYMLSLALLGVGRMFILRTYGLTSDAYLFFYYFSDTLLTIFLYFAILGLYQHVFEEMAVGRYIRWGGNLLLALTATVSYMMVHQNAANMTKPFVVELSQNLYFVGVVLTYLLWGAILQLRETRVRIVQLVLAMGLFFSAHAALYAGRQLFPHAALWISSFVPVSGMILPLAWAYTFTKVPEEQRLATARLARPAESHR